MSGLGVANFLIFKIRRRMEAKLSSLTKKKKVVLRLGQFAALPYRIEDGEIQFLLVTSRDSGQWIMPKGMPERNKAPSVVAAQEVEEEAGWTGEVEREPLGEFFYYKYWSQKRVLRCSVQAFLFRATGKCEAYKEEGLRRSEWVSIDEAMRRLWKNTNVPEPYELSVLFKAAQEQILKAEEARRSFAQSPSAITPLAFS